MTDSHKVIKCKWFTISVPLQWRQIINTSDPDMMQIEIDERDLITINFRHKPEDIKNYQLLVIEDGEIIQTIDEEGGGRVIEETTSKICHRVESNIISDIIDDRRVNLLVPKQPGQGIVGVFMEEPDIKLHQQIPFSITGFNVAPANEKVLLASIHTICFNR